MKSYRKPLFYLLFSLSIVFALATLACGALGLLGVVPVSGAVTGFIISGFLTALLIAVIHDLGAEIEKSGGS